MFPGLILYPPPPPSASKPGARQSPALPTKHSGKAEKSAGEKPGEKAGQQKKGSKEGGQERVGPREYSASRDSGIDTATVSSSNLTPSTANPSKKDPRDGFTDIAEDEAGHSTEDSTPVHTGGPGGFPCPEEKINLLTFDEIKTQYFQIQLDDEGLIVDRIIPTLADCWSRVMSELLGRNLIIFSFVHLEIILYRHSENPHDSAVRYPRPHPEDPDQQSHQTRLGLCSEAGPGGLP